jgi:hypothetical protein
LDPLARTVRINNTVRAVVRFEERSEEKMNKPQPPKKRKVIIDELIEQEKELTIVEWMSMKINEIFVENIPLEPIKQLPSNYKYIFGTFAHAVTLGILFGFLIYGYQQATHVTFISLHPSDGICTEIPLSVTGTYRADVNGHWEGSTDFKAPLAPYYLKLIDFKADTKTYRALMGKVENELIRIGQLAKTQDLVTNLLYWMMWSYRLPYSGSSNYFGMNGDPSHVFDRFVFTSFPFELLLPSLPPLGSITTAASPLSSAIAMSSKLSAFVFLK